MAKKETKVQVAAPKQPATNPAVPSNAVINKVIAHVQIAQPHAEYVYVNTKGEYHLHPRPGFVKVDMSDGEIMVDKIRTDRPIKLVQPKAVKVEAEANEDDAEDVAPPADGNEF